MSANRGSLSPWVWPTVSLLTGAAFCLLTDDAADQARVLLAFMGVGVALGAMIWATQRSVRAIVVAQTRRLDREHESSATTAQRGMLSSADADDGALSETRGPDDQPRQ